MAPRAGALGPHTPLLAEEAQRLTFAAGEELPAALERHLRDLHEADVILRLQARLPTVPALLLGTSWLPCLCTLRL